MKKTVFLAVTPFSPETARRFRSILPPSSRSKNKTCNKPVEAADSFLFRLLFHPEDAGDINVPPISLT
jgi:hypothetical protein